MRACSNRRSLCYDFHFVVVVFFVLCLSHTTHFTHRNYAIRDRIVIGRSVALFPLPFRHRLSLHWMWAPLWSRGSGAISMNFSPMYENKSNQISQSMCCFYSNLLIWTTSSVLILLGFFRRSCEISPSLGVVSWKVVLVVVCHRSSNDAYMVRCGTYPWCHILIWLNFRISQFFKWMREITKVRWMDGNDGWQWLVWLVHATTKIWPRKHNHRNVSCVFSVALLFLSLSLSCLSRFCLFVFVPFRCPFLFCFFARVEWSVCADVRRASFILLIFYDFH